MNVTLSSSKIEAMSHIRTMMKGALSGNDSDRATLSELNSRYAVLQDLEGDTVKELYERSSASFAKSRLLSDLCDVIGVAGLLTMIGGALLTSYASLGLALGVVFAGLMALLVGGAASVAAGKTADRREKELDHLEWLCRTAGFQFV
jgi:hypothetical protein